MTKTISERQNTRQEHSAGGVVYRKFSIKYLIGKHSGYHKWVLPKGLIEAGEKPEGTAVREVREEMGVIARVVGSKPLCETQYEYEAEYKKNENQLRRVKKYQEDPTLTKSLARQRVKKRVTWFLMEWVEGEADNHDFEMEETGWFAFEEALKLLAFEDERMVLAKARDTISQRLNLGGVA